VKADGGEVTDTVTRLVWLFALLGAAFVVGCGGGPKAHPSAAVVTPNLPSTNEALPQGPGPLGDRLTEVSDALNGSIDSWRRSGDPSRSAPPAAVTLQALYVQRVIRLLARRPRLASLTVARVPARLRPSVRDSVTALRDLMRLTPPSRNRRFKTGPAVPAGRLLGFYRAAQRRFGVAWNVLASVNFVETNFNRIRSSSSAGALGPMQFLTETWRRYGLGGDVHDPHDAIFGAANYLHRSGAPAGYRRALFAYNPSPLYVDAVLRYARRMAVDPRAYYGFYAWQVFVRTPSGDRRITGP
jgi:membrane-bound lytic murein transglycosylase B